LSRYRTGKLGLADPEKARAQLRALGTRIDTSLTPILCCARMALDLLSPKTALDLGNIRYTLIRLEDTIIFNLIERAQFPLNRSVYVAGAVPLPHFEGSFLDWLLTEVERTHGMFPAPAV
jgi:hypothetical protein